MSKSAFYAKLAEQVAAHGGYYNAHLHLDRSHTLGASARAAHLSLQDKHARISQIHAGPFYQPDNLAARLNLSLDTMVACGTRQADSVIDVTDDGLGLTALRAAQNVAVARADQITLRLAAYSPLGFRNDEPGRWDLMEKAAAQADFIGCLPERDDRTDYPGHIGFDENCRRMLDLSRRHDKDLQVHVDQAHHPDENGTERLLDVITEVGPLSAPDGAPRVWAVHMLSPSLYAPDRWQRLVKRLKNAKVGVIACPSAALGMRQLRPVQTPTTNAIARVLDLCAAGIPVRLGSDNLADELSPSTTADLTDEVFVLSACLRFYDVDILAKLACAVPLSGDDQALIKDHLARDADAVRKAIARWSGSPA